MNLWSLLLLIAAPPRPQIKKHEPMDVTFMGRKLSINLNRSPFT